MFFKDGKVLDIFGTGRYTLHTQNIPLIRKVVNLPFDGVSPFQCQVYFVNKVVSMDVLWGTNSPIPIQDVVYKIILPIRSNGQFGIQVADSKKLLIKMVGTLHQFDQKTVKKYFKGILLTHIKDYIAGEFIRSNISFLEVHAHLRQISDGIKNNLQDEFIKYGIELVHFNVNEITPSEDDPSYLQLKKALAKKAEMSVMGYDYQQERAFNVLDAAAANDGVASGVMGAGMGLGMGVNLGSVIGGTMGGAMTNAQVNIAKPIDNHVPDKKKCISCGAELISDAKFCPECGTKIDRICRKCGTKLVSGAKFCLECGNKIE